MFSPTVKRYIAQEVQKILQNINDEELPNGEIDFILHVDGDESWSWANIRNMSKSNVPVPSVLVQNLSAK